MGRKKRGYTPRRILFFNRVIYDRATIYSVTMPTDDCFVFTVVEKKKFRKKTSRASFCSYRLPHLSIHSDHDVLKFFFSQRCSSSSSSPPRLHFLGVKKRRNARKETTEPRGTIVPDISTTLNCAFNFYGIFGLKRQVCVRTRAMYIHETGRIFLSWGFY